MQSQRGFQRLLGHFRAAIEPVMQPCCSSIAAGELMRPLTSILSLRTYASAEQGAQAAAPREHLPPWTPTRLLPKWKALPKRMGHMLQLLEKEREEEVVAQRKFPDFGPGDVLEIKLSVPENKRRPAAFKGVCIARRNRGLRTSFTLRNFIGTSGGIERTFPLHSPHLLELRVVESRRVRRSKLYFLRDRVPREYRAA